MTTRGVDYKAQEDSREITWTDNGTFSVRSPQALDITKDADQFLSLTWRIDEGPAKDFRIGLGCSGFCSSHLDATRFVRDLPVGEWVETSIPLSCFVDAGLKPEAISAPLVLTSAGAARVTLHEVVLSTPNKETEKTCPI